MLKIESISNGVIRLIGDKPLGRSAQRLIEKNCGEAVGIMFLCNTDIEGIYTYGIEQLEAECFGHGPGYIWASRASVMNTVFDTALYEADYKCEGDCCYRTCAVDLVRFESMLNEAGYEVDFTPIKSSDGEDTRYKIVEKLSITS